ncbi:hypothetical protein B1A_01349, partial [mine drainage metagenome]
MVTEFRARFGAPSNLGSSIAWNSDRLDEENRRLLWEQIAGLLEDRRAGFDRMRRIWEKAAAEGFVPTQVPTAAGPQPRDAIFVTHDSGKLAHQDDDGSVVVLSRPAAAAWI